MTASSLVSKAHHDLARHAESLAGIDIEWDAPLGALTTLRVGGKVTALATLRDEEELSRALRFARDAHLPWMILGAGSNLLVPDDTTNALVMRLGGTFREVSVEGATARVGAAARVAQAARRFAKSGLSGLEFAAGIPGTMGGAVVMNASYGGRGMRDGLLSARLCTPQGTVSEVPAAALGLAYRTSRVRDSGEIVLQARIALEQREPAATLAEIARDDAHRTATQPVSSHTCGSVFKNPPGDHAGRLIDAAGLKGMRVGGAEVSRLHANFIVTQTGARSRDVTAIIERMREVVRERTGIMLECEVARLEECLRGFMP